MAPEARMMMDTTEVTKNALKSEENNYNIKNASSPWHYIICKISPNYSEQMATHMDNSQNLI